MHSLSRAGNSTHRADFGAGSATAAQFRLNLVGEKRCAHPGRTTLVPNVGFVLVTEVTERGQDRIGSCLAQTAEGTVFHYQSRPLQQIQVFHLAFADEIRSRISSMRLMPSTSAFPARLRSGETKEETSHVDNTSLFVHYYQAAGPHNGTGTGQGFIVYT